MAGTFLFELVAPERVLVSEPAEMVVVPGEAGDFGVLPGHAALISTLRPGEIRIYKGGTIVRAFRVESGFAEVTSDRLTVLAERAESVPAA